MQPRLVSSRFVGERTPLYPTTTMGESRMRRSGVKVVGVGADVSGGYTANAPALVVIKVVATLLTRMENERKRVEVREDTWR